MPTPSNSLRRAIMEELALEWRDNPSRRGEIEAESLKISEGLDEHPDGYDLPCDCDTCKSYDF